MVWYFELRIEQTITKRKEQESNQYHERRIRRKNNKDFLGLTRKTCSYLIGDSSEDKKPNGPKKCVIKRKLKFEDYRNLLEATQFENKTNDLEKKLN